MPLVDKKNYIYTYPKRSTDNKIKVYEGTTVPSIYDFSKIYVDGDRIVNLADYITKKEASFDNIVQMTYLNDKYLTKDILLATFNEYYKKIEMDAKLKGYYTIDQSDILLNTLKTTLIELNIETYYDKGTIDEFFENIDAYTKEEFDAVIKNMSDSISSSNTDLDERIKLCVTLDIFNKTIQDLVTKEQLTHIQELINNDILAIKNTFSTYVPKSTYDEDKEAFNQKYMLVTNMADYVRLTSLELILDNYFTKTETSDTFLTKADFNVEINKYMLKSDMTTILTDYLLKDTFNVFKTSTETSITDILHKFDSYTLVEDLNTLLDDKVNYTEYRNKVTSLTTLFDSYYDIEKIDELVQEIKDDINTKFNNVITMTDVRDELSTYATKQFVLDSIKDIPTSSTIVLKDYLETKLTEVKDEINSKFNNYALLTTVNSQISDINNKFGDYTKTTDINTTLLDYMTNNDYNIDIQNYVKKTDLNNTLLDYGKLTDIDNKISTALTTLDITSKLTAYVKTDDLNTKLADYTTTALLLPMFNPYVKTVDLNTQLTTINTDISNIDTKYDTKITTLENTVSTNNTTLLNVVNTNKTDADNKINTVTTDLDALATTLENNYFTKTEISAMNNLSYSQQDIDNKVSDINSKIAVVNAKVTSIDLTPYATTASVNTKDNAIINTISQLETTTNAKIDTVNDKFDDYMLLTDTTVVRETDLNTYKTTTQGKFDALNTVFSGLDGRVNTLETDSAKYLTKTDFNTKIVDYDTITSVNAKIAAIDAYDKTAIDGVVNTLQTDVAGLKVSRDNINNDIDAMFSNSEITTLVTNSRNDTLADQAVINTTLNTKASKTDLDTTNNTLATLSTNTTSSINAVNSRVDSLMTNVYNKSESDTLASTAKNDAIADAATKYVKLTDYNLAVSTFVTTPILTTTLGDYYTKSETLALTSTIKTYSKAEIDSKDNDSRTNAIATANAYTDSKLLDYTTTTNLNTLLTPFVTTTAMNDAISSNNENYYTITESDVFFSNTVTPAAMSTYINNTLTTNNSNYYDIPTIEAKFTDITNTLIHDNDNVFTKDQTLTLLDNYAKSGETTLAISSIDAKINNVDAKFGNTYTKDQIDTMVASKASVGSVIDAYDKTTMDLKLQNKASVEMVTTLAGNVYTITQSDALYVQKVDLTTYTTDYTAMDVRVTALEGAIPTFAKKTDVVSNSTFSTTLATLATINDLNTSENDIKDYIDTNYTTTSNLNTKLNGYVTTTNFSNELNLYVKSESLNTTLQTLATKNDFTQLDNEIKNTYTKAIADSKYANLEAKIISETAIDNKITTNNSNYYDIPTINSKLGDYAKTTEVNTLLANKETAFDTKYLLKNDPTILTTSGVTSLLTAYLPLTGGTVGTLTSTTNVDAKTMSTETINITKDTTTKHITDTDIGTIINSNKIILNAPDMSLTSSTPIIISGANITNNLVVNGTLKYKSKHITLPTDVSTFSDTTSSFVTLLASELDGGNMTLTNSANEYMVATQVNANGIKNFMIMYTDDHICYNYLKNDNTLLYTEWVCYYNDKTYTDQINTLQQQITDTNSELTNYVTTQVLNFLKDDMTAADTAIETKLTTLENTVNDNKTDADSKYALITTVNNLTTKVTSNTSRITALEGTYSDNDIDDKITAAKTSVLSTVAATYTPVTLFNTTIGNIYTKTESDDATDAKLANYVKTTDLTTTLGDYSTSTVVQALTTKVTTLENTVNTNKTDITNDLDAFKNQQLTVDANQDSAFNTFKTATNTSLTNINNTLLTKLDSTQVDSKISSAVTPISTDLTNNYFTKTEIESKISTIDLTPYAKKVDVYDKSAMDTKISTLVTTTDLNTLLTDYVKTTNLTTTLVSERSTSDGKYQLKTDFDTFKNTVYTKTETDNKDAALTTVINNNTSDISTLQTDVANLKTNTVSTSNFNSFISSVNTEFSKYALTTYVDTNFYKKTDACSKVDFETKLNDYFTKTEVLDLFNTEKVTHYTEGTAIELTDIDNDALEVGMSGAGSGSGGTFIPTVSVDGTLSWTNDAGLTNPAPINLKGIKGDNGADGVKGDPGEAGPKGDSGTNGIGLSTGGTTNQILVKDDATDYHTSWKDLKTINGKSIIGIGDLKAEIEAIAIAMAIVL